MQCRCSIPNYVCSIPNSGCIPTVGVPQGSILGPTLFLLNIMTFLMMLSVILLSMLMILLYTLNVIGHVICGYNYDWLLNLNLIYETLDWILMWKWMGLFLRKNHLLKCWSWLSLLNWIGPLTLSLSIAN